MTIQHDCLKPTLAQQFDAWKATPGGRHILNLIYRRAAGYAARYQRTGRQVSVRLLWELTRDHVSHYSPQMRDKLPAKIDGYRLNDKLHAYVARHLVAHRPEWKGMFQFRKVAGEA